MLFTDRTGTREAFAKDPAVVKFNGTYYMYYSSYYLDGGEEKLGIGIASSPNGNDWTTVATLPFEQECEKNGIGAPGAIVLDGKVHMFYQTYENLGKTGGKHIVSVKDAICHAVSNDGINFVKDESNPVFRPSSDWCAGRAIDADVLVVGDRLYLYFATRDHELKIQKIGVASAPLKSDFSRSNWTQIVPSAVVFPEEEWEGECTEAPAMISESGEIFMFYGGAYNCSPQQIGVAKSLDGVKFEKCFYEPFLPCGKKGEWNSDESGHPFVFRDDNDVWLYYQGTADKGKTWFLSRKRIAFENGLPRIID